MVCLEDMTEEELKTIKKYYSKLNELSVKEQKLQQTHSIDEAYKDNEFKKDLEGHISNLINKSTNPSNHGYINQKKLGKELIWRK
jgi:phosphoketolase